MSKAVLQHNFSAATAEDPINRALVVYTGFGRSPFPRARTGDLVAQFGDSVAADLKLRILALYEEMQAPLPDDDRRSRMSLTERATQRLQLRHPELSSEGLQALAWAYAFGMR